jgi:hypothetical protein
VEPVTKRINVTFRDGLPLGTRGSFTHGGQRWIAVPLEKYSAITAVTDRLLGIIGNIQGQMTRWVTAHPEDAERVVMILAAVARAEEAAQQAADDKTRARTS